MPMQPKTQREHIIALHGHITGVKRDLIVLTSDQSHYSIDKACMLLGIGLHNFKRNRTCSFTLSAN